MNDDYHMQKRFLEDQLRWCKERDDILAEIEGKLYKMKSIAEYAYEQELTSGEIDNLNEHLAELKREVSALEKQLDSVVH